MPHTLTTRQIRILALVGQGCSHKQIATACGTSARAVRSQMNAIRERLGNPGITTGELIRFAIRSGFSTIQPTINEIGKGIVAYQPRRCSCKDSESAVSVGDDEPTAVAGDAINNAA